MHTFHALWLILMVISNIFNRELLAFFATAKVLHKCSGSLDYMKQFWHHERCAPLYGKKVQISWPFCLWLFSATESDSLPRSISHIHRMDSDVSQSHTTKHLDIMADMTAKQEQLSTSYRPHHRKVTQHRVCAVWESRSALRLCRVDSTGVVSVGEMSHKVTLKLHSSERGSQ